MLHHKLKETGAKVWLVNTGWSGECMEKAKGCRWHIREALTAALTGKLNNVPYIAQPIFNLSMPVSCPGIPGELLHPQMMWQDKREWLKTACTLAGYFKENFKQYATSVAKEILLAGPKSENQYVTE